jgi:hypothetical protein
MTRASALEIDAAKASWNATNASPTYLHSSQERKGRDDCLHPLAVCIVTVFVPHWNTGSERSWFETRTADK